MELILWRHAEAEDRDATDKADIDRKLTPKGRRQAARTAKWLSHRLPKNAIILSSPARRTQQTVRALTHDYRKVAAISMEAGVDDVLRAAGWPSAGDQTVVIVGHQPTLGVVASLLLTGKKMPWPLKKSALIWLSGPAAIGNAQAYLRAAISADLI